MLALWMFNFNWGDTPPPITSPTTGGFSEKDYNRYRKHIEAMVAASERGESEKYAQSAKIIEKIAVKADIELPKPVAKISENNTIQYVLPNFEETSLALAELLNYIIRERQARIEAEMALDDDILMMVMTA